MENKNMLFEGNEFDLNWDEEIDNQYWNKDIAAELKELGYEDNSWLYEKDGLVYFSKEVDGFTIGISNESNYNKDRHNLYVAIDISSFDGENWLEKEDLDKYCVKLHHAFEIAEGDLNKIKSIEINEAIEEQLDEISIISNYLISSGKSIYIEDIEEDGHEISAELSYNEDKKEFELSYSDYESANDNNAEHAEYWTDEGYTSAESLEDLLYELPLSTEKREEFINECLGIINSR